ncbi:hypothetical protein BH10BAC5_BH10BAC5_05370 [soil metagenome]
MYKILLPVICLLIGLTGCMNKVKITDSAKVDSSLIDIGGNRKIWIKKDREIYKIVNNSGNISSDYIVILSHLRTNSNNKFDKIDFYRDNRGILENVLSDTTDFGNDDFVLTNTSGEEYLLLLTDIGGADTISSKGAFIYFMGADKPSLVKYFDGGSVKNAGLDSLGNNRLMIFDNYIGVLPAGKFITYTVGVFDLIKGEIVNDKQETKKLYSVQSETAIKEYDSVKGLINSGVKIKASEYPLYVQTVKYFVYNVSLNDISEILKFWAEEGSFLKKNLPEDEYGDLENFVTKVKVNFKIT